MKESIKYCELNEDKICDNCNECNICDLDPNKLCDSCGKCIGLEGDSDYLEIDIDGVFDDEYEADEYIMDDKILNIKNNDSDEEGVVIEYIEDIPELKSEYDKKISEILHGKNKKSK